MHWSLDDIQVMKQVIFPSYKNSMSPTRLRPFIVPSRVGHSQRVEVCKLLPKDFPSCEDLYKIYITSTRWETFMNRLSIVWHSIPQQLSCLSFPIQVAELLSAVFAVVHAVGHICMSTNLFYNFRNHGHYQKENRREPCPRRWKA